MASLSAASCPFLNTGTEQSETWGRVQGHLSRQRGFITDPAQDRLRPGLGAGSEAPSSLSVGLLIQCKVIGVQGCWRRGCHTRPGEYRAEKLAGCSKTALPTFIKPRSTSPRLSSIRTSAHWAREDEDRGQRGRRKAVTVVKLTKVLARTPPS